MYILAETTEERVAELKTFRDKIIAAIKEDAPELSLTKVMTQVLEIVTASNYLELELNIYELADLAIEDVGNMSTAPIQDLGEINRANAMKNLPSSMRRY